MKFEAFCMSHCCAPNCAYRFDYCPIADEVRKKYGKITGNDCELIWYEWTRREEKISNEQDDSV